MRFLAIAAVATTFVLSVAAKKDTSTVTVQVPATRCVAFSNYKSISVNGAI
jgi:hypothetical protein